jgi:hypothetical protein
MPFSSFEQKGNFPTPQVEQFPYKYSFLYYSSKSPLEQTIDSHKHVMPL